MSLTFENNEKGKTNVEDKYYDRCYMHLKYFIYFNLLHST